MGDVAKRMMVFVDDANFGHMADNMGRMPDLIALKEYLLHTPCSRFLVEMVVYMGMPPQVREPCESWQRIQVKQIKRRDKLEYNGIMTVTWHGKLSRDKTPFPNGDPAFDANVDVLMAMDAVEFAMEVRPDVVILVTGDKDFSYLATKLRRRGIRVEAATITPFLHPEFRRAVNRVIELEPFFEGLG